MGEVWRARHVGLGERVAVKLLRLGAGDDERVARNRFDLEAKLCARLARRTEHVVSVIDQGEADDVPFLVMELLSGETLEDLLASGGVLSFPMLRTVLTHVARALDCAHAQGIVHRDLKPSNVFLTKDADGRTFVKVLDFGIARVIERLDGADIQTVRNTKEGSVLGTPVYMSPEQAAGSSDLGPDVDVWAFGVLAYEALAGQLPFHGVNVTEVLEAMQHGEAPISTLRADAPRSLDAVFARAFSFDARRRYRSASSLAAAVLHAIETSARRREVEVTRRAPILDRRRWMVGGIAGAIVAAVIALSAIGTQASRTKAALPVPVTSSAPQSLPSIATTQIVKPPAPEPTVPAKKAATKPVRSEDKSAVF
jgi:serine/threonine-protein kinase